MAIGTLAEGKIAEIAEIEPMVKTLDLKDASCGHSERKLGDTETSYYLPSRDNGVNDMYAFRTPRL
jgi:hypothetical protein